MNNKLVFITVGFFLSIGLFAQESSLVKFKLKNRSALIRKVVLISYTPGDVGNGTRMFRMLPGGVKRLRFMQGTKIYLANQNQVNTVMSGNRIDEQKPFLIVSQQAWGRKFKF